MFLSPESVDKSSWISLVYKFFWIFVGETPGTKNLPPEKSGLFVTKIVKISDQSGKCKFQSSLSLLALIRYYFASAS